MTQVNTKPTALITGASGGIGLELAKIHARNGGHLIIVSRNTERLNQVKTELESRHKIQVHVLTQDLSVPGSAREIYQAVQKLNLQVDYLINNAGFGNYGMFAESSLEREEQMIQLNITTLTQFSKLFLQDMLKRGSGKIMNVASTGAFQPVPLMSVYCATKAYVLSFSEALSNEVRDKGVTVTALCPGPTESGFEANAAMNASRLFKIAPVAKAQQVAEYGYRAMLQGKAVAVHHWMNAAVVTLLRFLPRFAIVKAARFILNKA